MTESHDISMPALSDGELRLQAVLDGAVDGIITIDERGIIESANPAAERLFGYSLAEMIGQNVNLLMPSPYREEHDHYLANYLDTGKRRIIGIGREAEGRRKDGATFPMYLSVSEIRLGSRRLFTGIVHDLAELKLAEQAALRFGRVLEDAQNEIYIFDAESLKFELVNQGARENLGYTMAELRELTPLDLKPEFDRQKFSILIDPLRSGDVGVLQFETVHARKDGTTYPIEVHLQFSRIAGKAAFFSIILDITQRRQAESERAQLLTELESRVQELRIRDEAIRSASEGVVIADARQTDYPIVFVNNAFEEMTGYTAQEAMGRSCCMLHEEDLDQPGVECIHHALSQAAECHAVIRNYRKDGTMFWNDISIAPVLTKDGETTHVVGVMEDVTDRRRMQERLVQTERLAAIGEMVTGLAHESRNALQRAQACLDMLSLDLEDKPDLLDLTKRSQTAIDDLRRLYEEVRNYAAPINLERRVCNLGTLMRKVWADLSVVLGERRIELVEAIGDQNATCCVDAHRIEQVIRNILENAIAVCPDPGRIEIECAEAELNAHSAVRISFRDNGPGLEEDASDRIFQPFFTTKQKGTGLGMAIAKRVVETHGGRIEIGNVRSGAEIVVTLPR